MSMTAKVAKVSVALTPEMTDMVQEAVASGDYASASEVIREALREWKQRRAPKIHAQDELRRLWEDGLASGPGQFASIDEIKQHARRRKTGSPTPPGVA